MTVTNMLMDLIRSQICGAKGVEYVDVSAETMSSLYSLSKSHDMSHILAAELEKQGLLKDDEIGNKFRKQQMIAVFRYEHINYEFEIICKTLQKNQIPFVVLKGSVIRKYYPEPWMRTSSDIDFLIHEEDVEKIKSVMLEDLNIRYDSSWGHEHSFFSERGGHIEFHDSLNCQDAPYNEVLENAWNYVKCVDDLLYMYEMTDEMFYFYHIAHMAKHFVNGGCGIRPFIDIWVLNHNCEFDKKKRCDLLDEAGLLQFAKAAAQLSEVWIGNEPHTPLSEQLEQFILSGGTYGTAENRVAVQQAITGGKFSYIMSRVFLPYDQLKLTYPNLEKRKWLFPFYQIKRWFRLFGKVKLKKSMQEAKITSSVTVEENDQTTRLLKELGIK